MTNQSVFLYTVALIIFAHNGVYASTTLAAAREAARAIRMSDATRGTLLTPSPEPGMYHTLPTLHTDVRIRAHGISAKVTMRQRFKNPNPEWLEGIYVFPLPDDAAVTRLRMVIGEKIIRGEIQERRKAKQTYEKAKLAGVKASLIEQERPNIFTASVANIGPGESITIELDYMHMLRYQDGEFSLRVPLVVGPRYVPGAVIREQVEQSGTGWALDTDIVRDASRVTPPVAPPGQPYSNPVSIDLELDAGFSIGHIESSYHRAGVQRSGRTARLQIDGPVEADRDFEVTWAPRRGDVPRAAVFTERFDAETYALLLVVPPADEHTQQRAQARNLTLVIDTSGSMQGLSIAQATAAAGFALDRLGPDDTFNLIQFNSSTHKLFPDARPVTPETIAMARHYLSSLRAQGGTEMAGALEAALGSGTDLGRVRQIVFITDGSVGNERHLLGIIENRLGDARLFTVGIGSAPNAFFMRRAAEFGRGTFTFIGNTAEVSKKMAGLFRKLRFPLLTDVEVSWPDAGGVDAWPARMPDLYHGEPLIAASRMQTPASEVTVSGKLGGQPWTFTAALGTRATAEGVATIWARQKIKELMDRQFAGDSTESNRQQIIELSIEHHLVSRYTSLVAVDVTPVRGSTGKLHSRNIATKMPHGWSYEHVFGLPNTATGWPLQAAMGFALLLIALTILWCRNRIGSSRSSPHARTF
ncbi:marine proteobacterial sortase target protein [Gammaproteobacteria bacterium]|nr:marine proteobacterial sortase target protein [Gammaproteobacteria bacterium]